MLSPGARAFLEQALRFEQIGSYRIVRPLGEGGMGLVYRGEHVETGEPVAIKIVRVHDENLLASFRREVHALRSLEHPAVVRIVADGVADGHPWYAMGLIRGQPLGDLLDERARSRSGLVSTQADPSIVGSPVAGGTLMGTGTFDDLLGEDDDPAVAETERPPPPVASQQEDGRERLLGVLRDLCDALAYVHGEGLVHRDLKPDNVVIAEAGHPVLVDFGLALSFGARPSRDVLDVAGRALGTPPYMSPEQARGDLVDARSDLYSLGCILYEAVTGSVPFSGTPVAVLNKHLNQAPRPPSELRPDVPPELDELIGRLLAKRPRERIGYAADVARALDRLGSKSRAIADAPAPKPYLYRPALAGRREVRQRLRDALEDNGGREGALVLLSGRSGIGKTRLAMDLANRANRHGMRVVTGHGVDTGSDGDALAVRAAPLHALRELLLVVADRCRSRGREETDALLGDDGPILAPYEPSLSELPGQAERPPPAPLPAEAARLRVLEALGRVVSRYVESQPLFLVIDDLQWADELSVSFLQSLDAGFLAERRLRVVATYRSEEENDGVRAVAALDHVTDIQLGALDREAVEEMVRDMLALSEVPAALVDFLMEECAGNPFFIAEYLRVAIGQRILERSASGVWAVGRAGRSSQSLREALPLPGGLRELIHRRLEGLQPAALELVEIASVLGSSFDGEVLLEVAALEPASSRSGLAELRQRQILEEEERGGLRFSHHRVRERVHAGIDDEPRRRHHRRAAEAIERRTAGTVNEALSYAELAHHFSAAGVEPKALEYLARAGEHALDRAASADARRFFTRALELGERLGVDAMRRAGWQRRLGEACYNLGALTEARRHLRAALRGLRVGDGLPGGGDVAGGMGVLGALRRRLGSDDDAWRSREAALAAERLGQAHFFLNEPAQAFGTACECVWHAEGLGPSAELARASASLSVALGFVPAHGLADRLGARAERIAAESADPAAEAFVSFLRGLTAVGTGRHADARRYLGEALRRAKKNGDVRASQEILGVLGNAHFMGGDLDTGRSVYEELEAWARQTHNPQGVAWAQGGLGCFHVYRGAADDAVAVLEEAAAIARELDDQTQQLAVGIVAFAHRIRGDWSRALEAADGILELAHRLRPAGYHCHFGYVGACEVYLAGWERALHRGDATGRWERKALEAVRLCERLSRIFPMCGPEARCYRGIADGLSGRRRRARRVLRAGLREAMALDLSYDRARAHYELSRHLPPGHRDRAFHLSEAGRTYEALGARWWHERVVSEPR